MRIDIAAQSDIDRRKKDNEDSFGVFRDDTPNLRFFNDGALLIVADGLGGHMGGEIASKLAVSMMKDIVKDHVTIRQHRTLEDVPQHVEAKLRAACADQYDSCGQCLAPERSGGLSNFVGILRRYCSRIRFARLVLEISGPLTSQFCW